MSHPSVRASLAEPGPALSGQEAVAGTIRDGAAEDLQKQQDLVFYVCTYMLNATTTIGGKRIIIMDDGRD